MSKQIEPSELHWQLYSTLAESALAAGGWDSVVLMEQAETLARFIDHPHAVPEPAPAAPRLGIWPPLTRRPTGGGLSHE